MTSLRISLDEYLATRRALGFKLKREGQLLPSFIAFLRKRCRIHVTTSDAIAWATQPHGAHPAWWTARLVLVRGFAKHLRARDPRHEVPPLQLLPHHRQRRTPYVYSDEDIQALMVAAGAIPSPLMAATYTAVIGLLAATGLRVGEAIALDDADVDRKRGLLVVRKGKFGKTREVLLHPTTVEALVCYATERDRRVPRRGRAASSSPRSEAGSSTRMCMRSFFAS